ncbi:PREDICTED: doublecortin domain-containing protein 2B [Calidris pugnax]|uniref:doublecortin domain-containing protein 2B n=1 Tax=Calidris pugnax TaxID=198806 RepID=UPI00071C638D|nr:PREDICTED: doublecortin domain-containing protein 2B [Calidris pugnax]
MSLSGLALAPPAKNVVVYRNGDPFFPGRKFVVNQRRFLTFEAFLNEVTKSICAPLAVRNLYTPRHGRRVAELGDLQDGHQYVAAGFEKFRRLNYLNHGRKDLRGTRNSQGLQFLTVAPWKSHVSTRWQKRNHPPCRIHVFRNGDLLSPPFPLLLSRSTPLQWDTLLATLTERADLHSGAVSKLCRLDGTQVSGGEELVNGDYYVAVGNEEYKKLPYFELLVPQDSVHETLRNYPNSRHKTYHRRFGELCATSQLDRLQATGPAEKDKLPAAFPQLQRQARKSRLKEEENVFHVKPVRAGQNRRSSTRNAQHWPDQEEIVYKPRNPRTEIRGAQEVKEDEHKRVDVPIDQRVAEELTPKARTIHSKKAWTADKSQKTVARKRDASASEEEQHSTMFPWAAKSSSEFTERV